MAKVQLEIDVGDLEKRIADAVYERVRANFGALMADALRGNLPVATPIATPVAPAAPAAPVAPAPPPVQPAALVRPRGAPIARPVPVPMPWSPPAPTQDRNRLPPAARAVLERADRIYEAIRATPWLDAEGIAAATGYTVAELSMPLKLMRGKDSRGKPTGEPARIQDAGSRRWKRYAVVGVKVPTDLR